MWLARCKVRPINFQVPPLLSKSFHDPVSIWFLKSILHLITDIYAGCFLIFFLAGSSNALDWAEPTGQKRGRTTYRANRKSSCQDVWSIGCISLSTLLNSHRHRGESQTRRDKVQQKTSRSFRFGCGSQRLYRVCNPAPHYQFVLRQLSQKQNTGPGAKMAKKGKDSKKDF